MGAAKCSVHSMEVLKNLKPEDNPSYCGCSKKGEGFYLFGLLCSDCDKLFHSKDKDSCQSKSTFKSTIKSPFWACPNVKPGKFNFALCKFCFCSQSLQTHTGVLSGRTRSPKREQGTKHPFSKDD